ncbi:hypothetical protein Pint_27716 [Pistacia integerrima]|uniref:Uncharacterized protein n=1 Tax=Pistacia integerrima TaxID=434235 RepID=A0ACC0YQ08_9ROSI|nr:hypothetical protein Pint_27716 [Pistacia integerrima]
MGVDRISYLPPFIIHQIMSHLSRKQVAQTSILSKKWNYLLASFPIFNFDETDLFQSEFDILAAEKDVKELDITIKTDDKRLYIFPHIIYSAKLLTTLRLNGFKFEKPPDTIRFFFLKKLELVRVHISETVVEKLTSECVLLEELYFRRCWGLKCVCICKPDELKILQIHIAPSELERVKVDILGLQQLDLVLYQRLCEIDVSGCSQLKDLRLACCLFCDEEFHYLLSQFPLLENLSVSSCFVIKRIKISSDRLKNLSIGYCSDLEAIDVDTPNLLSFGYEYNSVPLSSMNAPCPWKVRLVIEHDLDTNWYLKLKKFLASEIKELTLRCTLNEVSFDLEEFRNGSPSPPCKVGYVSLSPTILSSDYGALLDALLWICYPKCLVVETWNNDHINLIEVQSSYH